MDKGLLYKGHKIMPYCPRCGTSLSSHEVAQGYKDVKENSLIVKFKVLGRDNDWHWITTPWTLPSNLALCVNPNEKYVRFTIEGDENNTVYIMAEGLIKSGSGEDAKATYYEYTGEELKGTEYEPLYSFVKPDKKAYYVIADDHVTMEDGTGVVHTAPAFGEDDARVCKKANGLPFINLVDDQGNFVKETGEWAGTFVKDADKLVIRDLKTILVLR